MNSGEHITDEDLAFYAMHSLSAREADAIESELSQSAELRERLIVLRGCLRAYAESVELSPMPEGSLERFMKRLAQEKAVPIDRVPSLPRERVLAAKSDSPSKSLHLAWIGWAIAACLAVTAGDLYHARERAAQTSTLRPTLSPSISTPVDLMRERDELRAQVVEQERQIEQLTADGAKSAKEVESLQALNAAQATRLKGATALLAEAQTKQDTLRNTLAAQASQVAQLTQDSGSAHQITGALTDPTALRVTLARPKSHPTPSGRATYVLSKGTLVFFASNLAQLKDQKVYQLWLMPADGSQPVPAGTFAPDARGNAAVVYAQLPHAVAAKGFSVTIENAGGAQTPTLPILLAGSAG